MTKIYRVKITNPEFEGAMPPMYFETEEAAQYVMGVYDAITTKGKKINWECEVIDALSKEDAYNQMMEMANKYLP